MVQLTRLIFLFWPSELDIWVSQACYYCESESRCVPKLLVQP